MRKLIAWIAKVIGIKTHYFVATRVVTNGECVGYHSGGIIAAPWLTDRNLDQIRHVIAAEIGVPSKYVHISSITRIGA